MQSRQDKTPDRNGQGVGRAPPPLAPRPLPWRRSGGVLRSRRPSQSDGPALVDHDLLHVHPFASMTDRPSNINTAVAFRQEHLRKGVFPISKYSVAEDGVYENLRVERREVVRALAETDQLDRHAQLPLD